MSVFKRWGLGWGRQQTEDTVVAPAPAAKMRRGQVAEDRALDHLRHQGLTLVERNYRVARGPSRRAGEIDLVMHAPDGTLVFVEVRARRSSAHGGAAASVGHHKRTSLIYAAQHFLLRYRQPPPCRFDLVAIDGDGLQWLPGAFDAG